jgi:deoxyribose-phosphate aldolase
MVCTVVGFPLGAMTRLAKAAEARITVAEGAQEVDMVIDVGGLCSGDLAAVYDDILGVVAAARPMAPVAFHIQLPNPAVEVFGG